MTATQEALQTLTLRERYDPSGQILGSDESFYQRAADWHEEIAQRRGSAVQLLGFGALHGSEVVLANSLHANLEVPLEVTSSLRPGRMEAITEVIHDRTDKTVRHIARVTGRFATDTGMYVDSFPGGTCDHMAVAGQVLMHYAHDGAERRSGDPYTSHTEAAAGILDAAWNLAGRREDEYDHLRLLKFIARLHDAPECTNDIEGEYLNMPIIPSPLVIGELVMHYGVEEPIALKAAQATHLLDNSAGMTEKMPYDDYNWRGARIGGIYFLFPKGGDREHNAEIDAEDPALITDPKRAEKAEARVLKYKRSKEILQKAAKVYCSPDDARLMSMLDQVTEDEMAKFVGERLRPIKLEPDDRHLPA